MLSGFILRDDILEQKDTILQWISENKPKAFMCKELKCKYSTLNSYLKKMGIDYSGNRGRRSLSRSELYISAKEYFNTEKYISSYKLKNKMIYEGLKEYRCEMCGNTTWLDNPIPLELHHKDGNSFNNFFDNLQLLCPNCHSFTDTYRSKNSRKKS